MAAFTVEIHQMVPTFQALCNCFWGSAGTFGKLNNKTESEKFKMPASFLELQLIQNYQRLQKLTYMFPRSNDRQYTIQYTELYLFLFLVNSRHLSGV